ncbi:MAG: bacteriohemerythrin [Magnetococcus sp. YQC-9]
MATARELDGFQRRFSLEDFRESMRIRLKNVAIPALHAQHENLVELIVKLYAEVRKLQRDPPGSESLASLRTTLDELKNYATRHFQEEEAFMRKIQYPGFEPHRQAHQLFVKSVLDLEARIWQESVSYVIDLLHLVVGWLFQHINQLDMAYARFSRGEHSSQDFTELHTPPALKVARSSSSDSKTSSKKSEQAEFRDLLRQRMRKTGIERFDQEHLELMNRILRINQLTEKLASRKPTPKDWEEVDQANEFLFGYCRSHFLAEESWMDEIDYPKRTEHAQEHRRLLTRLKELSARLVEERNIYFIVDMNLFVTEWFLTHSVRLDLQYAEYARAKNLL